MVTLNLSKDDLHNIVEFIELNFFEHLKALLNDDEIDNIDYIRSLLLSLDELTRAEREAS